MAVTNDGLMTATGSASGSSTEGVRRSFTRTYKLTSTSIVTDDENVVLAAVGISLYSRHPTYFYAWVTDIKVELQDVVFNGPSGPNGAIWHATVEYGWLDPLIRETSGSPLAAPILWDVKYEAEEEILEYDVSGDPTAIPPVAPRPIVNTAGQFFDPPATRSRQRGILSVYVNIGSMDAVSLDSWGNRINAGVWNTFPAQTVLLLPIEIPQRQYDEATDTVYWPMVFRFQIRNPETWKLILLNQGYCELRGSGSVHVWRRIMLDGMPATNPVPLDSAGLAIVPPSTNTNVVYLSFDQYKTLDFSVLGLDSIPDFPTS